MPHKHLKTLDETIELYDAYYRAVIDPSPDCINDRGCELRKRLNQLSRLVEKIISIEAASASRLERISALHKEAYEFPFDIPREWLSEGLAQEEDLELYTETFYYLAFRARNLIRSFPNLNSFESKGIRDVRNHLLEHPEGKASGIHINSFAHGAVCGPVIKGIRYDNQVDLHKDRGLYVNLEGFLTNLRRKLKASLRPLFDIDFSKLPTPDQCAENEGCRLVIQLALCIASNASTRNSDALNSYLIDRHKQVAGDAKLLGASDANAEQFAAGVSGLVLAILANPPS